jgi:two-component system, chemotaxis family, chemotaxis protein CheY
MPKHNQRILIVDDDPVIGAIYRKKFEASGFVVQVSEDATSAVAAIAAFKPIIVLLDLNMPGRNGVELLQNLRAVPKYRDLAVVVVTSEPADSPKLAQVTQSGVTGVMRKDEWSPEAVLEAVKWAMSQPQREAARKEGDTRYF